MPSHRYPFFTSARGRLLSFNLLMVAVTLMVAGVAILGFRHASLLQEQVQRQTLDDIPACRRAAGAAGADASRQHYSPQQRAAAGRRRNAGARPAAPSAAL